MAYHSMAEIIQESNEKNIAFWEVILRDDCDQREVTTEDSMKEMGALWKAMLDATYAYNPQEVSASGLAGKEGGLMEDYLKKGDSLSGDYITKVIARALQMGESNACMKRIVAAPTAGACGVLPSVLTTYYEEKKVSTDEIIKALYAAAGVGQVIASRAFISGAAGGCQAEIGSASVMATGALVSLKGGSAEQIGHACAMAMNNLMGLVCDPVAGLVEVPCIKRNVIGAVNALSSADMALAGLTCPIPVDEVIDAMREVGERMDPSFKETSEGGLAATKTAKEVMKNMRKLQDVDA